MADADDHDIPETGAVFTFGKSKFADNVPSKFWIRNDRFLQVACGDEHTALVAESGRLFTFGSNEWGQLGVGNTKPSAKPTCVKSLKTTKISKVACGRSHTIVATRDGKLFTFGANNEGQLGQGEDAQIGKMSYSPVRVESIDNDGAYKMLSAGTEHSAALTDDGRLFMWGGGGEGQLGLGPDEQETAQPQELTLDSEVTCVSCGYYHTAVVTASGRLYTFGENESGQLGYTPDEEEEHYSPQYVDSIAGKVKSVSCGGSHTLVLTDDGRLWSFGDGSNGQLGHGNTTLRCSEPQPVKAFGKHKIMYAECGENHSAVITEKGQMYTFGDGRHGKLALGQENFANQFKPYKVARFQKFTVEELSCGGCHSLVLAKPRLQNGEISSSDSEIETTTNNRSSMNSLRRSHTLDAPNLDEEGELTFTPRERRQKANLAATIAPGSPMLNRTLPPLRSLHKVNMNNTSDFAATIAAERVTADRAAPVRSMPVPTITTEDHSMDKSPKQGKGSEESDADSENDDDDDHKRSNESPKKPSPQRRTPFNRSKSEDEKLEKEKSRHKSEDEDSDVSEDEKLPSKPSPSLRSSKPQPAPRRAKDKLDSEEDSEDLKEEKEKESDEEENEEEKNIDKKKKGKSKKEKKKEEKKRKGSVFGKKKVSIIVSEDEEDSEEEKEKEEDEDEEEEESEVETDDEDVDDKKKSKKKNKGKDKKKEKEKLDKEKEEKLKEKERLKEEKRKEREEIKKAKEEEKRLKKEKADKKKKKGKKGKKKDDEEKSDDEEDSEEKEETIEAATTTKSVPEPEPEVKGAEDKGKEEEKKTEPPPKPKKSKLCTIL